MAEIKISEYDGKLYNGKLIEELVGKSNTGFSLMKDNSIVIYHKEAKTFYKCVLDFFSDLLGSNNVYEAVKGRKDITYSSLKAHYRIGGDEGQCVYIDLNPAEICSKLVDLIYSKAPKVEYILEYDSVHDDINMSVPRYEKFEILDANERVEFRTIADLLNVCMGTNFTGVYQKCTWKPKTDKPSFRIWCPKLAKKKDDEYVSAANQCVNIISDDWNEIVYDDLKVDNSVVQDSEEVEANREVNSSEVPTLVFAKEPGNGPYIFRGLFIRDLVNSSPGHHVNRRIATKIRTIGSPVNDIEIMNNTYFEDRKYWWVNATEEYWKIKPSEYKLGEVQSYALYKENGPKQANVADANPGDLIIIREKNNKGEQTLGCFFVVLGCDEKKIHIAKVSENVNKPIDRKEVDEIYSSKNLFNSVYNSSGNINQFSFCKLTEDEFFLLVDMLKEKNPDLSDTFWDFLNVLFLERNYPISNQMNGKLMRKNNYELNTILYGPPGTGKTFNTVLYAVSIIDDEDYESLKEKAKTKEGYKEIKDKFDSYALDGQIAFTTFHQSYGYEEFIEGIRPVVLSEGEEQLDGQIKYKVEAGVFKKFCQNAKTRITKKDPKLFIRENATVWNVHLGDVKDLAPRKKCFEDGSIRIGWEDWPEVITYNTEGLNKNTRSTLLYFQDEMKEGDVVVSFRSVKTIDGIGIITGPCIFDKSGENYPRKREVKWLMHNKEIDVYALNNNIELDQNTVRPTHIKLEDILKLVGDTSVIEVEKETRPFVFIIDEINRGNMSKIFGELITLIEDTKRIDEPEEITAILPYSNEEFSIPANVYILGTMNTADRSIALMDTALRRRFSFVEMPPKPELLDNVFVKGNNNDETVNIGEMLRTINRRITHLYDREHTIGHAPFMKLIDDPSVDRLASIFSKSVIPLLQEYFYEDYSKIRMILGDNAKENESDQFITEETFDWNTDFFGNQPDDIDVSDRSYKIMYNNFKNISCYKGMVKE